MGEITFNEFADEIAVKARDEALLKLKIYDLLLEIRRLNEELKRTSKEISRLALQGENHKKAREFKEKFIDSERQGLFKQKVKTIKNLKKAKGR